MQVEKWPSRSYEAFLWFCSSDVRLRLCSDRQRRARHVPAETRGGGQERPTGEEGEPGDSEEPEDGNQRSGRFT